MDYLVVEAHKSTFPEPIEFRPGDRLRLGKRDDEYPGWIWVITPSGRAGWAPESLIRCETDTLGVALQKYTARELDTCAEERVRCLQELAGWLWVENEKGRTGWIPKKSARPLE